MEKFAFIHIFHEKKMLGIVENDKLISHQYYSDELSSIYRGRVEKYLKSLDAYVVDIGLEKKGLLRKKNARKDTKAGGQVIVELISEGDGDKLYDLTEKFSISDGYLVLKNNIYKDQKYDLFLRSMGKALNDDELAKKEENISKDFYLLKKEIIFSPTPKLLRRNTKLRDFISYFDGPVYNNIEDIEIEGSIRDESYSIAYNLAMNRGLKEIENRKLDLDNGLELVFDKTEACYVIDVNTGSFRTDLSKKDLSRLANFEVLDDLARLIAIKNIKKMLIIDFIRMTDKKDKLSLISEFEGKLEKYKVKSQILGFTKMGLFEMIIQ